MYLGSATRLFCLVHNCDITRHGARSGHAPELALAACSPMRSPGCICQYCLLSSPAPSITDPTGCCAPDHCLTSERLVSASHLLPPLDMYESMYGSRRHLPSSTPILSLAAGFPQTAPIVAAPTARRIDYCRVWRGAVHSLIVFAAATLCSPCRRSTLPRGFHLMHICSAGGCPRRVLQSLCPVFDSEVCTFAKLCCQCHPLRLFMAESRTPQHPLHAV